MCWLHDTSGGAAIEPSVAVMIAGTRQAWMCDVSGASVPSAGAVSSGTSSVAPVTEPTTLLVGKLR